MKLQTFAALLLLGLAHAAPSNKKRVIVNKEQFPEKLVKYTGEHDIVKIVVPVNSLNFDDFDSIVEETTKIHPNPNIVGNLTVFFIEADVDESGKLNYQGLYVLKNNKAKKILENGRDAAASSGDNTRVYLAASDGLYLYNDEDQSAQKYGSITDNIIAIDKESETDVLYILTEDNTVYKVTDNGNKKEKLEDVKNAQKFVIDNEDNLYFYTTDKKLYVRTSEGVKQVAGLPEEPSSLFLPKCPIVLDDLLPILVDEKLYIVYANGTSTSSEVEFATDFHPTAFAPEGSVVQYYGYNKKIYEFNLLAIQSENNARIKSDDLIRIAVEKLIKNKNKE
ncbi:uncharacterized protein LOC123703701 [Colias croceus]|uniref:uncharacterized protein LOC123703701 n=1 Tax=Colias crocea TaxID=72248 RepID=UPI001E27BEF2|nr:uncharacterized protein LOC123703701 [Colias croceus]